MIAIITRCHNRLEYTTRCVANVRNVTEGHYTHVIIDNNSTDGTKEWFKWLHANTEWYKNLLYLGLNRNAGDWGGMIEGHKIDADYYVQLDNDILVPQGWLTAMREVLEQTDYKVVMLKRSGIVGKWILKPLSRSVTVNSQLAVKPIVAQVERPVACWMASREWMDKFVSQIPESSGAKSKYMIRSIVKNNVGKIMNYQCLEMDIPFQREKYNPKNPEVWEKL